MGKNYPGGLIIVHYLLLAVQSGWISASGLISSSWSLLRLWRIDRSVQSAFPPVVMASSWRSVWFWRRVTMLESNWVIQFSFASSVSVLQVVMFLPLSAVLRIAGAETPMRVSTDTHTEGGIAAGTLLQGVTDEADDLSAASADESSHVFFLSGYGVDDSQCFVTYHSYAYPILTNCPIPYIWSGKGKVLINGWFMWSEL